MRCRGLGSGAKILNHPVPPAFRENVKVGEQNLYARAKELVGDRDPRSHEYSVQLRPVDADKSGAGLGLPMLVACVGGLLERSTRGGTILVGPLNLGGSVELIPNPVALAELAVDKQAATLLKSVGGIVHPVGDGLLQALRPRLARQILSVRLLRHRQGQLA